MSDSCVIGSAGATTVWNPTTEQYDTTGGTTVYSGKCRVKSVDTVASEPDAGATTAVVVRTQVDIPVGRYDGLAPGLRIVIDSARFNPLLVGINLRLTNVRLDSQGTALRLLCTQEQ